MNIMSANSQVEDLPIDRGKGVAVVYSIRVIVFSGFLFVYQILEKESENA